MIVVTDGRPGSIESAGACACGCVTAPPYGQTLSDIARNDSVVTGMCTCACGQYDSGSPGRSAQNYLP